MPLPCSVVSLALKTLVAPIISTKRRWPPEKQTMPPNGAMMSGSIGRIERTGPIASGCFDCQIATRRVRPPSTISSKTMSVELRPSCGRAASELSILQATDGLVSCRASGVFSSNFWPVSGAVTKTGSAVGVVLGPGVSGLVPGAHPVRAIAASAVIATNLIEVVALVLRLLNMRSVYAL